MAIAAHTLIIGASAAGLACARCLEEQGLEPTVLEAEPQVGKMWRGAYERLHLHTPRSASGLPYLPMPASYPRYASRQQVVAYLETYAARLKHPPIFGQTVQSVRAQAGRWHVRTADTEFVAGNVVVATGNTRWPVRPHWEGMDRYGGRILHTSEYRTGEPFRGQEVLVVGFGNSACEIAIDLHEHGAAPALSVRGPVNVIPRDILGVPVLSLGLLQKLFSARVADEINAPLVRLFVGDITRYGLQKLPYGATTQIRQHHQIPLLDIGIMALIRQGKVKVRPAIDRFTETGVVFGDGSEADYDAVILGTGYRAAVDAFLAGAAEVLDADGTPLVSGEATARAGLFFCGFNVVPGGSLRQIGIEARRIAERIAQRAPGDV